MRQYFQQIVLGCCGILALAGCGEGPVGGPRAAVRGEVTLDGQPLEQGSIMFLPAAGTSGQVTGGPILAGRYSIPAEEGVAVGVNRVEITAMKKSGKQVQDPFGPPGKTIEMEVPAVAARFNTASTLKLEVKVGDNAPPPFAVQSK